jgi:hypothetical protein
MYKKYRIKYKIIFDNDEILENKEIKVDKCYTGVEAQVRLEDYLKRKYINLKKLIVTECKEEPADLFSQFGDIFNPDNMGKFFGGK